MAQRESYRTSLVMGDKQLKKELQDNIHELSKQYAAAWVSDLDAMTGGKLGKYASGSQMNDLKSAVASASYKGNYVEDLKQSYANSFDAGFRGRRAEAATNSIIRGFQNAAVEAQPMDRNGQHISIGDPGFLPPTAAGQDMDLRASAASDLGVQLSFNGALGDNGELSGFLDQKGCERPDERAKFGADREVSNAHLGDDRITLPAGGGPTPFGRSAGGGATVSGPSDGGPTPFQPPLGFFRGGVTTAASAASPSAGAAKLPPDIFTLSAQDQMANAQRNPSAPREAAQTMFNTPDLDGGPEM